jgi:hypothetical protein
LRILAADFPHELSAAVHLHHTHIARQEAKVAVNFPRRMPFEELLERYAAPVVDRINDARRYLTEVRGINAALVDRVIEAGDIWANRWGSCVFAHRTPHKTLTGCSIRATNGSFKQSLGDKTNAWFSIGCRPAEANQLVLTESAIDALSYFQLETPASGIAVISTSGQSNPEPIINLQKPLILAHDIDESGEKQAGAFHAAAVSAGLTACRQLPEHGKDWNEFLLQKNNEQQTITNGIREREQAAARRKCEAARRELEALKASQGVVRRIHSAGQALPPNFQHQHNRGRRL